MWNLKRITHKPRNPANRATEEEQRLLERFQAEVRAQRSPGPVVVLHANRSVSVYVPIVIPNALCLMCYGKPGTEFRLG